MREISTVKVGNYEELEQNWNEEISSYGERNVVYLKKSFQSKKYRLMKCIFCISQGARKGRLADHAMAQ